MELQGKIKHIGELETYQGRDNQQLYSRQLVLVTDESHPQTAVFTLRNNIAAGFVPTNVGKTVTVHFDFAGFQSKNDANTYYNKLSAWRVDL